MIEKRFIFTVTTGRTGTLFMTNLLPIFKGVTALHEPKPKFSLHTREIQTNPQLAKDFLINEKVPAILSTLKTPIYIEMSNFFCKGYLEPWLEISEFPIPDLILLNRDLRKISLSNVALSVIPARTEQGLQYMLAPFDPTCFTHLEGWESLSDYQLSFWYGLEIEERKKQYARIIQDKGGRVLSTSLDQIKTVKGILEAKDKLGFAPLSLHGWASYFKRRRERLNLKKNSKAEVTYDSHQLDDWEAEVRQRMTVVK
jgi:hypothetical protein